MIQSYDVLAIILIIFAICGVISTGFLLVGILEFKEGFESYNLLKPNLCYDMASINDTLNTIAKNCGSTHITKEFKYASYSIFTQVCKGDYCKHKYIPLGECLK